MISDKRRVKASEESRFALQEVGKCPGGRCAFGTEAPTSGDDEGSQWVRLSADTAIQHRNGSPCSAIAIAKERRQRECASATCRSTALMRAARACVGIPIRRWRSGDSARAEVRRSEFGTSRKSYAIRCATVRQRSRRNGRFEAPSCNLLAP